MRKPFLFILIMCFATASSGQTISFKGAWFEVKYPASFTAKPSLKAASAVNGYESAFFESPDKLVEFYVFSPQWSGDASDILLKSTEKMTSTKTQTSGHQLLKWWTIAAKDGSYTRTYQEKRDSLANTGWVIGIKYKQQSAFNKYKTQYLAFKSSLVQYAD